MSTGWKMRTGTLARREVTCTISSKEVTIEGPSTSRLSRVPGAISTSGATGRSAFHSTEVVAPSSKISRRACSATVGTPWSSPVFSRVRPRGSSALSSRYSPLPGSWAR
jgi:hypothetical protein